MNRRPRATERQRAVLLLRELLEGKTHSRQSIAELLGVSLRTADRWMKVLERLPGVERDTAKPLLTFAKSSHAARETLGLVGAFVRGGVAPLFAASEWGRRLHELADRLVEPHGADARRKLVYVARGREDFAGRAAVVEAILEAVWRSRVIRFDWRESGKPACSIRVQPLSLVVHDRQLYLFAREVTGGPVFPYPLREVSAVAVESATFAYPSAAEYDPEALLAPSFGVQALDEHEVVDVRVRLTGKWASFARGFVWHESQRLTHDGDAVIVQWTVAPSPELEALIRSFGSDAQRC